MTPSTTPRIIRQHGNNATLKAREMIEALRRKGDACADTWLRIIVAIGELGTPSTNAQH